MLYKQGPVATRIAPVEVASGISLRPEDMPRTSLRQIARTCDHYLDKLRGDYTSKASRLLFELVHDVKVLLQPLDQEDSRTFARLQHLEGILAQWHEVFGAPSNDMDLVSPASLAAALQEQKSANDQLRAEAKAAISSAAAMERRCLETLALHHKAHAQERDRLVEQHAATIARMRAMHEAQLSHAGMSVVM